MIYDYISIKNIVEGLYRDYNHQEELDVWDIVEWVAEALELVGTGQIYYDYIEDVPITNHRGVLPCNFSVLQQISYNGYPMRYATGTFEPSTTITYEDNYIKGKEVEEKNFPQLQDSNNFFHGHSYYIKGGLINTSIENGCITMAYRGFALDKEGFPMIPKNVSLEKAVKAYCQMMLDRIEWRNQRIPNAVYSESKSEWNKYAGQARGSINMPNLDAMESIKNQWVRLKPDIIQHSQFFKGLGNQENLRR